MKKYLLAAATICGVVGFAVGASADPAWEFTSPGNSYTDGTWDFATAFTVNNAVTATGLGYYADPVTGNADGNPVAFYQCADTACLTTGTLLAQTDVTNIYALDGHFRYVTIAPITLIAGDSYEVAGVSNTDNYTWDDPGYTVDPDISLLPGLSGQDGRWEAIGTPDFLTTSNEEDLGSEDGYWGPNVFFGTPTFVGAVPEPSSLRMLLAGLGMIGGAFYFGRKKKITA
jgi:hypothetical protein